MIPINTPADAHIFTPKIHAETVEAALERGRDLGAQEQFEKDVKAACYYCKGEDEDWNPIPLAVDDDLIHERTDGMTLFEDCNATYLRRGSPARAARLDARPSA